MIPRPWSFAAVTCPTPQSRSTSSGWRNSSSCPAGTTRRPFGFATPLSQCNDQSHLVIVQYHGPEGFFIGGVFAGTPCGVCQIAVTSSGPVGSHIIGTFAGTLQQENGSSCNATMATIDGSFDAIREADG